MKKIEIGTLVRFKHDGDLGIVTAIFMDHGHIQYRIKWGDGSENEHVSSEFEVIA